MEYKPIPLEEDVDATTRATKGSTITDIRVTIKDLERFGTMPGCPACEYVRMGQKIARGVPHSKECRQRIRDATEDDERLRERVARADARQRKHEVLEAHVGKSIVPKYLSKLDKEMRTQMLRLVAEGVDVAEIYSPPRVCERAKAHGLRSGTSFDITTRDKDGRPWDFSKIDMRERAVKRINKEKPLLIVDSPMCTD